MKLRRAGEGRYIFTLARREKEVLFGILKLYPRIPAAYQPLSKTTRPDESSQGLLNEALNEQRAENRKQLEAVLGDKRRLARTDKGWSLTLSAAEVDWLLQVLNDIRVGSWVSLGSPEKLPSALTEENAPDVYAMEVAGAFQSFILDALETGA